MKKLLILLALCFSINAAIVHDTAIVYKSTIDTALDLKYDISYDDGLTGKPLAVLLHGWSLDRTTVTEAWKERLINNYSVVCLSVDMRGRTTSEGSRDANARELYDVYDAINDAISNYSTRIDPTNINALGYSGGGGNALKLACAYPDLFGVVCSFFGMSDYGYDDPDGWWHTTPAYRATLESWVGDTPANVPDNYYSRSSIYFLSNAKYSRTRVYHDDEDSTVPIINAYNIDTTATTLNLTKWVIDITTSTDDPRWAHGSPIVGDDGEPNIQAEATIFSEINSETYKNPTIEKAGTFFVPGNIKTKSFSIWLNDGETDAATLNYSLNKRIFTIINNKSTTNNYMDVEFEYYGLNANTNYTLSVNGYATYAHTDGDGTLCYYSVLDSAESVTIVIQGVTNVKDTTVTTFGEVSGTRGVGDHKDTWVSWGNPDFSGGNENRIRTAQWIQTALMRFSIDSLPTNAVIISATLSTTTNRLTGASEIDIRRLNTDWGVNKTTSGVNEDPATGGQATAQRSFDFNGAGGDITWTSGVLGPTDYGPVLDKQNLAAVGDTNNFDVTDAVQYQVLDDDNNTGFIFYNHTTDDNRLNSFDATTDALKPYLIITWGTSFISTEVNRRVWNRPKWRRSWMPWSRKLVERQ